MGIVEKATRPAMVLQEFADGVCTLTLNRPDRRNALSMELMSEITASLDEVHADKQIRVVILAAAGPVFCSGHDLKEMRAGGSEIHQPLFSQCSEMMLRILSLRQPVIAKVHGPATAAGCQLVASCDLAIAADTASFSTPGVNIGLFCSTPMVALSRAVHRKHALDMLLTGRPIPASRAFAIGLVSEVVPVDMLDQVVSDQARHIATRSAQAIRIGKEAFYRQIELDVRAAYELTSKVMVHNMAQDDAELGIDAFLGKKEPVWSREG